MQKSSCYIKGKKMIDKTLIIFDTNAVYNRESDLYKTFRPLQDFSNFLSFLKTKKLRDRYILAISKMGFREIVRLKKELIKNKFEESDKVYKFFGINPRIKKIDPEDQISQYCNENKILTLPYPTKLKNIIKRAENKQNPFRKSGQGSDVGFKDVILWESILAHRYKSNKIIFFTRDSDFNQKILEPEFKEKFPKKEIVFFQTKPTDWGIAFQQLKASILSEHICTIAKSIIKKEKAKIKNFIVESYSINLKDIIDINTNISRFSDTEVKITAQIKLNGQKTQIEYYLDVENKEPFIK